MGVELYSDYIEDVVDAWWGGEHEDCCTNGLGACIDNILKQDDDIDQWRCCPYWRRKLTNKLSAREFAIRYEVPAPELYWFGRDVNKIPFDELPPAYVIKASFGTSAKQVIPIIDGRNVFDNTSCPPETIKQFFSEHMSRVSPYGYIMIEELLTTESGEGLANDYKAHVFDGRVQYIAVIDRSKKELGYYTREWDRVTVTKRMNNKYTAAQDLPRPKYYSDLIAYAERLGKGYGGYVRTDLYMTNKGCVFGEFTGTPGGGAGYTLYANRKFAKLWRNMSKQP